MLGRCSRSRAVSYNISLLTGGAVGESLVVRSLQNVRHTFILEGRDLGLSGCGLKFRGRGQMSSGWSEGVWLGWSWSTELETRYIAASLKTKEKHTTIETCHFGTCRGFS